MSPDHTQTIGGILAVLVIGAYNAIQARRANKQTKSTGNGFAKHVKDDLAELKAGQQITHDLLIRHLEDHAESDLRRK